MALTGYSLSLVQASWMTVQLAFTSLLVGLILAVVFASGEMSRRVFVKWPTTAFVTIVRGLPEILVVLFIYFGSTQVLFLITGDFIEPDDVGVAVVSGSREGGSWPCACRCWVVVKGLREGSGIRAVSGLKDTITVSGLITNGICVVEVKSGVAVSSESCGVESELNAISAER